MEEEKEKIELQEGIKPVPGIPSNFGQGTTIFQTDDSGKITRINTSGAPLDTRDVKTKEEYENPVRVGDYYYSPNKTLQVWENSPTDLIQKATVAIGGTEKPENTFSLKNEGLGVLSGAAIGSILPGPLGAAGAAIGALAGGLNAHNAAAEEALKQWQEQDVKYDTAVEFYKDKNGDIRYEFDYDKMGTGGPRSGEAVKEAQNRETKVSLGDDGRLKVTVSPIFASTERFQELTKYISENYGGLSKDTENLDEVLTEIKDGIDGEVKSYVSNMKLYADFAHRFPNASPETVVASYTTEVSGFVKPDEMKDYQVAVLEGDEITTKSAKEFFDSVLNMDKGQRNELTKKLNDIVYGDAEGYDDNKRAIAYGELQSMFVASANTEEHENDPYQGMMDADPFVSFLDNFAPLGLNGADVVSFLSGGTFSKQEYLNQNDFAEFLGGAAGIGAGLGLWKGGTKLVEGALKRLPGSAQLFNASLEGQKGGALAFFAQNANDAGAVAKAATASAAFKTLKVGIFDAALAGAQTAVSEKDFWAEFGQDFARDAALEALFSYYDLIQYQKFVNDSVTYVYRDPKTGNIKTLNTYQEEVFINAPGSETLVERSVYNEKGERVGGEWVVQKEGGTAKYEPVGAINFQKTRSGDEVGIATSKYGTTYYYNGKVVNVSPTGEGPTLISSGDIGIDESDNFPALNTGVVDSSAMNETEIIKVALEREGLPLDTEVLKMSSNEADSAIVAGKIAKLQGTKAGVKVYENLFNKNGILDMANNLALAKDGDLNAWRNAQEQFVSVSQNAQNNLQDIQRGVYIKSAAQEWQNTVDVIGGFNIEFKYKPKIDGAYINAINQIQRAQLLNVSRPEGDTTDYVAKALEVYGDAISKMPQDRAEALQGWLEQGKKWLKVFNQSVRKSGKIDVKLLDRYTDTDIENEIGYFPVWAKKTTYKGLLDNFYGLSQQRNPYKDWLRNGEWVPLEELEDPYLAMTRYMGFMANNMGLNDRNEAAAKVMERADILVDNTPTDATIRKRKLESIKNKDELTKKLDEMVEAKKKEVKEATLTPKQYNDAMTKIYEDSAIEEVAEALGNVDKNIVASETMMVTRADYPGWDITDHPVWALDESSNDFDGMTRRDYYRNVKGKEFRVLEVPTNEYNQIMMEDDIGRMLGKEQMEIANSYVEKFKNGERADIPYIEYDKNGKIIGQEGRKRTAAAYKAGIKKVPVVIEYPVEAELPKNLRRYKDVTEKFVLRGKPSKSNQQWDDFWKNAPAQTRKDIRNELEKTSLQTGYGISDTRARLNAQVPGADVLDWSLLGRDHTNGLVPGGLYAGKNSPVKAYIISIDDLAKLAGYDLDNAIPNMGKVIESNINTEGGVPMLPAHIRGSGDGPEIWLKMRWGHNSDSAANWIDYLKTLKERGIEKVPVAIDDARGDYNTTFYRVRNTGIALNGLQNISAAIDDAIATGKSPEFTVRDISAALHVPGWTRERLRNHILRSGARISGMEIQNAFDEADEYNWSEDEELNSLTDNIESVVEEKLGYAPQDITADVQQAFSEYGQIPFYRGQRGLGKFNMNDESSATAQVGDAYWIAPNASYTDSYGKDKLAGTIPVKYFMSDKEKATLIQKLKKEYTDMRQGMIEKTNKLYSDFTEPIDRMIMSDSPLAKNALDLHKKSLIATSEIGKVVAQDLLSKGTPAEKKIAKRYISIRKLLDYDTYTDEDINNVASGQLRKDLKKYLELEKIVDGATGEEYSPKDIQSYRALAEYAKKPIIDISEDGFADGTAFFYFKGVDPEFDEEIGRQLTAQLAVEGTGWTYDKILEQAKKLDTEMTVQDLINFFLEKEEPRIPELASNFLTDMYNAIDEGNAADAQQYWNYFLNQIVSDEPEIEAVRRVLDRSWDGDISQPGVSSPEDIHLKLEAMINTMGVGYNIARNLYDFLELPTPESELPAPTEEQASLASQGKPIAENIPTEPQFMQPRKPTYEDYQKGLQADSSMAGRIQDSYRGALSQRLIKEASRVVGLAEDYLSAYSWGNDWQSYLNTSLIPDLKEAINQRMLPEEFKNFVQARMVQAVQDVAPYQSPELIMKSQLENVAQEWRDWAEKKIKAGRFTQKELREFAGSHNLELPKDKRPYPSKIKHALWQMVQDGKKLPSIEGLSKSKISKDMAKEDFYKMLDETPLFRSAIKDKQELVDLVAAEKNGETIDGYTMGASATALGLGGRYPWTWFKNGKPYTRFIKADTPEHRRWAEEFVSLANDKELVREEGLISRFLSGTANDFRLLTTGWDPSRVFPNITRDTTRSFTIGTRFINAKKTLQSAIEMGNYTSKQKELLSQAIENAAKNAANSSYNSAYRSPRSKQIEITKEYLSQTGANPMKRFMYNLVHDKRSIAEFPMEFFEGWSRRNNARSLAAVQLGKDQAAGMSFEEQLQNAVDAATFAGREYTANFQRKGKLIGRVSKYVAYQSSAYAGLDGMMRAFIDNPKLVARNFAVFVIAYLILLGDTLSREETRKQYYRLSEYDRENQIVIGMGDSILTIPMDQELAGLLYPYRAIMETLEGTDQVSFFQFLWGTFTEWMPMDLSGFSEGDGFNLARGLEKLTAQNMPTGLTPIQEAATGYDLYYGNDISVSADTLEDYGIYDPQAGDYTTNSKDSLFLRNVANMTGIPQWQLQTMWEGYGGNVGKYVLNIIDKAAGATKEQQGGKDFADTVFNSFTALDQDAASNAFYDGLNQLKKEKNSLLQKIANYNEDLKTASGEAKVELQNKIQKAKEDYGVKVGDFVDKYVSAYDITGGLPKSQAQQIYYLFRLDDDNSIYESGSVEEYYQRQAQQKFENQATALSAPILDKYYNNRIGNIYQDSDGVWRRYLSGGAQAMRNSIYGHGEQQMVDLLNILEGKDSNLTNLRSQVKDARSAAYEAGNWDARDAIAYEFDKKVIEAISPYIEKYGAENVLGNSQVLDYLSDWFFVPNDFKRTKRGGYVSLANNAQTDEAFVRPFIKYIFGLPTNFSSYRDAKYNSLEIGK